MTIEQLEQEVMTLLPQQRLALAQKLLESLEAVDDIETQVEGSRQNPLLKWAGVFEADPDDVAERAEEILLNDIQPQSGFGE